MASTGAQILAQRGTRTAVVNMPRPNCNSLVDGAYHRLFQALTSAATKKGCTPRVSEVRIHRSRRGSQHRTLDCLVTCPEPSCHSAPGSWRQSTLT